MKGLSIKLINSPLYCLLLVAAFLPVQIANAASPNVRAWGTNNYGQCDVPADLTNAIDIAAGKGFSMALLADGTVRQWGQAVNPPAELTNIVSIAAARDTRLALHANGKVSMWGLNTNTYGWITFVPAETITDGYRISAFSLDCAQGGLVLTDNGVVRAIGCVPGGLYGGIPSSNVVEVAASLGAAWRTSAGQAGAGVVMYCGNYQEELWWQCAQAYGWTWPGAAVSNFIGVAASGLGGIALTADGRLFGAGCSYPTPPELTNVIAIVGGDSGYLVIRSDHSVAGIKVPVPPDLPFTTAVAVGSGHYLAIVDNGTAVLKPTITAGGNPSSRTKPIGSTVSFSVRAAGSPPLTYQWYYNGTNALAGATNAALILPDAQPTQSGSYHVEVCNPAGCTASGSALLSVVPVLNGYLVPSVQVKGGVGFSYRLEYINAVGPTSAWVALDTITLTNSPQFYFDISGIGQPVRLYRAVQTP